MGILGRAFAVAAPICGCALVGGVYYRNELRTFASTVVDTQPLALMNNGSHSQYISTGYFNESYVPLTKWNYNWDNRAPDTMISEKKYEAANEEEKKELLAKAKPTATRNIFLIRHGQYHLDKDTKHLTELGREQAGYLGKRLAASNIKFDPVVISTMNRANETASLMLEQMDKTILSKHDSMIEEGAPYPPEPAVSHWKPKMKEFYEDGARIEAAFRKHIHRASAKQKEDSNELIVCHANVIRYFVCRALQFPPEGWLRIGLGHTSITWLVIRPNGTVSIRTLGDIGHLPIEKVSFS